MYDFTRRSALAILGAGISEAIFGNIAFAKSDDLSLQMILNDPDAPIGGNPQGDLTIVAFLDYNCPYCKKAAPDLERIIKEDGKIRLVYKDWPVIFLTSIDGAKMALAAKYQGKYETAHRALMKIPGSRVEIQKMRDGLKKAGIDLNKLDADAKLHARDIETLMKRNMAQADALGLQGTPTFLVGEFMASTLDYKGFKMIVADARSKKSAKP